MKKKSPKVRSKSHHPKSKQTPNEPKANLSFKVDPGQFGFDFQSIKKHTQAHRKGLSMPKISSLLSVHDRETVMSKHRLRQEAMGEVCLPQCNMTDVTCNCEQLFGCVKKMDEYDLAVLTADGYIDTASGSETYGEFSVSAKELNLFNLDQDIRQKLQNIKDRVDSSISSDQEECLTVLGEFRFVLRPLTLLMLNIECDLSNVAFLLQNTFTPHVIPMKNHVRRQISSLSNLQLIKFAKL